MSMYIILEKNSEIVAVLTGEKHTGQAVDLYMKDGFTFLGAKEYDDQETAILTEQKLYSKTQPKLKALPVTKLEYNDAGPIEKLINCESCNHPHSILADKCPQCGAPNNWIHPAIKHFLSIKDQIGTTKEFKFQWNKVEIWGYTETKLPWYIKIFIFFGFISGVLFGIIPGFIIAILMYLSLSKTFGGKYNFKANLLDKKWESSNEKFWKPVRDVLKV